MKKLKKWKESLQKTIEEKEQADGNIARLESEIQAAKQNRQKLKVILYVNESVTHPYVQGYESARKVKSSRKSKTPEQVEQKFEDYKAPEQVEPNKDHPMEGDTPRAPKYISDDFYVYRMSYHDDGAFANYVALRHGDRECVVESDIIHAPKMFYDYSDVEYVVLYDEDSVIFEIHPRVPVAPELV